MSEVYETLSIGGTAGTLTVRPALVNLKDNDMDLAAVLQGRNSVRLTWTQPGPRPITGYRLQRRTVEGRGPTRRHLQRGAQPTPAGASPTTPSICGGSNLPLHRAQEHTLLGAQVSRDTCCCLDHTPADSALVPVTREAICRPEHVYRGDRVASRISDRGGNSVDALRPNLKAPGITGPPRRFDQFAQPGRIGLRSRTELGQGAGQIRIQVLIVQGCQEYVTGRVGMMLESLARPVLDLDRAALLYLVDV